MLVTNVHLGRLTPAFIFIKETQEVKHDIQRESHHPRTSIEYGQI